MEVTKLESKPVVSLVADMATILSKYVIGWIIYWG